MPAAPFPVDPAPPTRWPSATEYNEAVQNPGLSMTDEELRGGQTTLGTSGMPLLYAGAFANVYQIHCPATNNTWAVKCFTKGAGGLRERYQAISEHLATARLPFMVDFQYLPAGILIGGNPYPIVKLRWVEGLALNQFAAQSLNQPQWFEQLLGLWVKLASRLRSAQIAHADLQHGNVMLVPKGDRGNPADNCASGYRNRRPQTYRGERVGLRVALLLQDK